MQEEEPKEHQEHHLRIGLLLSSLLLLILMLLIGLVAASSEVEEHAWEHPEAHLEIKPIALVVVGLCALIRRRLHALALWSFRDLCIRSGAVL